MRLPFASTCTQADAGDGGVCGAAKIVYSRLPSKMYGLEDWQCCWARRLQDVPAEEDVKRYEDEQSYKVRGSSL